MSDTLARIKAVQPGSPADSAGIKAGEYVHSVNGERASDYIAWLWESDGAEIELEITDAQGKTRPVTLQRDNLQDNWGIEFDDVIFDGIHRCKNDCVFCFMKQLPTTARKALCVRDDDYRLSFLMGNFITLTNLKDEDKQRIVEQRISPLRLSFHAADDEVRRMMIGKNHDLALKNFDELIEAGIDFHIQIVLVPGLNDGDILENTLAYLKDPKRLPHVLSVGIVPVAYTDHAPARLKDLLTSASLVPADREEWTKSVIDQVQRHQFAEFEERELTWVYLADEFYIHAHAPFPLPKFYDGFPQLENGIGMVLNFIEDIRDNIDSLQSAIAALPQASPQTPQSTTAPEAAQEGSDNAAAAAAAATTNIEAATIVCGELLTQTWLGVLGGIGAGGKLRLLPVKNRFFGGNVSVTGLLSGADLLRAIELDSSYLKKDDDISKHLYLIPDCIFNDDEITLDDYGKDQLIARLNQIAQTKFYQTGAVGLAAEMNAHAKGLQDDA